MIKTTVSLHCGSQWKWKEIEIIADTKEIALDYIYKNYKHRDKPYTNGQKIDSLEIIDEEELNCLVITGE